MAVNDPYDRSGQYSGGDTGPKVEGYGGLASQNPDRRDHAIGTMMGEGGRESAAGYGGILDSIENRVSAIMGGANYGTRGNSSLESVVTARNGREYNSWSPSRGGAAYGTTQRGLSGNPKPGTESGWYDQAREVYDDYYHDLDNPYRGSTMGSTFYQNDAPLTAAQRAPQQAMRDRYGSVAIGAHTFTGPGFGTQVAGVYPDQGFHNVMPMGALPGRPQALGQVLAGNAWSDLTQPAFDDLIAPPAPQILTGMVAQDVLPGTMIGPTPNLPAAPQLAAALVPQPTYPVFDGIPGTPGYGIIGGSGRGDETGQRSDRTVADFAGGYGGYDAFGPNDPFGGWGFGDGYADVVDSFIDNGGYGGGRGSEGGTLGDGSYSESSGRNDNNPQGIL